MLKAFEREINESRNVLLRTTLDKYGAAVKLAQHLIDPKEACAFPRAVPTQVAPKYQTFSHSVSTAPNEWGALIVHPDVYQTIETYEQDSTPKNLERIVESYEYLTDGADTVLESNMQLEDGTAIGPSFANTNNYRYAEDNSKNVQNKKNGVAFLPGTFTFASPCTVSAVVEVSGQSLVPDSTVRLDVCSWDGSALTVQATQTVGNAPNMNFSFSAGLSGKTFDNLVLRISRVAFEGLVNLDVRISFVNATVVTHGVWTLLDMLDIVGSSTLTAQVEACEKISYTGMHMVMTNVTADLYKGGSLRAAQLPGGSVYPTDPAELWNFIDRLPNSYRTYREDAELRKGMSWSYVPEKIQDLFFLPNVPRTDWEASDRPILVAAWKSPSSDDTVASFDIKFGLAWEMLTNDVSSPVHPSPPDYLDAVLLYMQGASRILNISHNPNHKKRISDTVSAIARDPDFRTAAESIVKRGLKLGTKALVAAVPALL